MQTINLTTIKTIFWVRVASAILLTAAGLGLIGLLITWILAIVHVPKVAQEINPEARRWTVYSVFLPGVALIDIWSKTARHNRIAQYTLR